MKVIDGRYSGGMYSGNGQCRNPQHDRKIAAIRKLVLTGMKMLVEVQRAQNKTEQTLERSIRSSERRGENGQHKRSVQ